MPDVRREVGRGKGYHFHSGVRGPQNPPSPPFLPALCECTLARKCQDEGGEGRGVEWRKSESFALPTCGLYNNSKTNRKADETVTLGG